jgi:hypothetical protein
MSYEAIEEAEPALTAGLFTGVAGFAALLAASLSVSHSAGVAVGMSASQALLTRPAVYSPRTVKAIADPDRPTPTLLPQLFGASTSSLRPDEPAATIGVLVFLAGFLVQLFAGVDMTAALVTAAGIAGVQTAATRSRVYSPATTQLVAALQQGSGGGDRRPETAEHAIFHPGEAPESEGV